MNPFEYWLHKLESKLQSLVEGTADRLTSSKKSNSQQDGKVEATQRTAPLEAESSPALTPQPLPDRAFLVVDGTRMFSLNQTVVSIGRAPENDLVISDQRVSRQHAQLRAVAGRFVIFDLESTGGTSLNGRPVTQQVLNPGDVVSLAGVPLVYGEDGQPGSDLTQELNL